MPDAPPGPSHGIPISNTYPQGSGPKDWAPRRPIKNSSLLSRADEKRLQFLDGSDKKSKVEEWLLGLVRKLAALRPEEHQFPQYAALVNQISCSAYAMRYDTRRPFLKETRLLPTDHHSMIDLLGWTTSSQVCDAILFVRPFVKFPKGTPAEILEMAGKWTVTLTIDGEQVEKSMLLDEILVKADGNGIRRQPYVITRKPSSLFLGVGLNEKQEADPSDWLGLMLPNNSFLQLVVHEIKGLPWEAKITAGVVAASYTTKAH